MTTLNAGTVTIASFATLADAYRKADAYLASVRYQIRLLDELSLTSPDRVLTHEQHDQGVDHIHRAEAQYWEYRRLISLAIIIIDGRLYREHPLDIFLPPDTLTDDYNYTYAANILNADDAPAEDACVTAAQLREHMTPEEVSDLINALRWITSHEV